MCRDPGQQKCRVLLYRNAENAQKQCLSDSILGDSPAIRAVRDTVEKLSKVPNATILLLGDSGTGKSLTARVIHYSSMPAEKPFIDINCAALPDNLIESELFGHEKGAFTNAVSSRPGLLQAADDGTIFLNEIGELPINLQAKLLTVVETRKFRRLGSNNQIRIKARIMAATNRNLRAEVARKKFRTDLYHRLNVVSITMPPLNSMGDDIIFIAQHLLRLFNSKFGKQVKGFSQAARLSMLKHSWPGNVRELSNCVERAMIFCENDWIDAQDLNIQRDSTCLESHHWSVPNEGIKLDDVERQLIQSALTKVKGNKTRAAKLLGLTRDTLRYRLDKYQISI